MPKINNKSRTNNSLKQAVTINGVREIIYPKRTAVIYDAENAGVLTETICHKLLGWQEENEDKFGSDFLFVDGNGKKVRCLNDVRNRPLYISTLVPTYMYDILNGNFVYNGETIIIGETGIVCNGQHQLVALGLAIQEWRKNRDKYPFWGDTEPYIEKLISFGTKEDDKTINTMDTCKPRSLMEVIYRSDLLKSIKGTGRKAACSMLDYAIRGLWDRTGAKRNAYCPKRSIAESLDFLARHSRIMECVKHIYEETKDNETAWVKAGMSTALMYLMACSSTDRQEYFKSGCPNETMLDFSNWDKACDFWTILNDNSEDLLPVRNKITDLMAQGYGNVAERVAIIIKAWNLFVQEEVITYDDLQLKYKEDESGYLGLAELPTVGGIDIGKYGAHEEPEPSETSPPTKLHGVKRKLPIPKVETANTVYVSEDGGYWVGELVETYKVKERTFAKVKDAKGKTFDTDINNLSSTEPL